jgi:nucleoside-diphosphate-sugar epimerase
VSVLITGGYGHIGSWVARELLDHGQDVVLLNRSRRRLSYLEGFGDRLSYFQADMMDYAAIYRCFEEHHGEIEGVVHVAGIMGGPAFALNPHYNIRLNTMGTVELLEACRTFGVGRFIYVSSGSVYGARDDVPSEDVPVSPSDLYGAAKASAELLGMMYASEFELDFRAIRVYFAYGPGRMPSELYPLYGAVFGPLDGATKITLPAGRDQSVDFAYVKDIALGVRLLYSAPTAKHRVYNISTGWYAPISELIAISAREAGASVEIDLGPGRIMPRGPSLDSTRLRDEFGFSPRYSFEDGIREYLDWIKMVRNA